VLALVHSKLFVLGWIVHCSPQWWHFPCRVWAPVLKTDRDKKLFSAQTTDHFPGIWSEN